MAPFFFLVRLGDQSSSVSLCASTLVFAFVFLCVRVSDLCGRRSFGLCARVFVCAFAYEKV